jgi:hypothetical protein
MCCTKLGCIYKRLPYLHAAIAFLDMILGLVRLGIFFTPPSTAGGKYFQKYTGQFVAAFVLDWISCIAATLVGFFTIVVIFKILWRVVALCYGSKSNGDESSSARGSVTKLLRNKAVRRFLIIDCNCPCYKARPKLRFQSRFIILLLFCLLRIVSIGLYASAGHPDNSDRSLALICAFSLVFLFNTLWLDLYRYFVWWHYTPANDTWFCGRSKKHERYLPYHMAGCKRDAKVLGDRPCIDNPCQKRTLDHIAIFHRDNFQPQQRWRDILKPPSAPMTGDDKGNGSCWNCTQKDEQPHYIGFHRTDPDSAVKIVRSEFRPGAKGWIGGGVYFARSIEATIGKARSYGGAYIIAEIRMGKVYEVDREVLMKGNSRYNDKIYQFAHEGQWKKEYDTCYLIQESENKDEFAIKDPAKQIVKWVVIIEEKFDKKVEEYGLATEFDTTWAGCI